MNNKRNCKLLINNGKFEISESIDLNEYDLDIGDEDNPSFTISLIVTKPERFTNLSYMFDGCPSLESVDFKSFNSKNITNTAYMFYGCEGVCSINFASFNTENVTNMEWMFGNEYDIGLHSLETLNLSSFNTEKVKNMRYMFRSCANLKYLDLSSFNTMNVTNMESMFERCSDHWN